MIGNDAWYLEALGMGCGRKEEMTYQKKFLMTNPKTIQMVRCFASLVWVFIQIGQLMP